MQKKNPRAINSHMCGQGQVVLSHTSNGRGEQALENFELVVVLGLPRGVRQKKSAICHLHGIPRCDAHLYIGHHGGMFRGTAELFLALVGVGAHHLLVLPLHCALQLHGCGKRLPLRGQRVVA